VLGLTLGRALGLTDGFALGLALGRTLGLALGRRLGHRLGFELGRRLGVPEGSEWGCLVGKRLADGSKLGVLMGGSRVGGCTGAGAGAFVTGDLVCAMVVTGAWALLEHPPQCHLRCR
jgi:hypothetical protein